MPSVYLGANVLEAAIERLNFIFDECDDIVVSMSGGKDSTVLFNLAMIVAKERGRLPLKVMWLDHEAEWQSTVDYMRSIMYRDDIKPYWYQIPFRFTNSLSFGDNFLNIWDPDAKDLWIHPQDPISIKVNPTKYDRFHSIIANLSGCCDVRDKKHVASLVGMRIDESYHRRQAITYSKAKYKGMTWCSMLLKNVRTFWPIYDFTPKDIWKAIAQNGWDYNRIYDQYYRYGVNTVKMRVSALIHETAWTAALKLQEIEPVTYNRFVNRVVGANCFNQFQDEISPKKLPYVFSSWREYRDYLLESITQEQYRELFRKRWAKQDSEDWHKLHVHEILINDIDGTVNSNYATAIKTMAANSDGGQRYLKMYERFKETMEENGGLMAEDEESMGL
jgi:predicted phosphoadenosine phosphosulfate sulfurtransferase